MANVIIDGIKVDVPDHATILQAAKIAGIKIPTLCYHPDQEIHANCRICVCQVEGLALLQAACSTPVRDGMVIRTNTATVIEARRTILQLILAHHPQDCLNCIRNRNCELQTLADEYLIRDNPFSLMTRGLDRDTSTPALVRDPEKCILCRRCEYACSQIQTVNALGVEKRGQLR